MDDIKKLLEGSGGPLFHGEIPTSNLVGTRFYSYSGYSRFFVETRVGSNTSQVYEDTDYLDLELGGVYSIGERPGSRGIHLLKKNLLLEPDQEGLNLIDLTPKVAAFLEKSHVFTERKLLPKLGILNCGPAGTGKTHSINKAVKQLLGTNGVALYYAMDTLKTGEFLNFIQSRKLPEGADKIFLVIEDLGGGEDDDRKARTWGADSTFLGLLDGNLLPWKDIPIVLFSTTNHKRNFMANIIDRPGRFDDVYDFDYPSGEAISLYVQKLIGQQLTDFDRKALLPGKLSVAHARDAAVKFLVYGTPIHMTVANMRTHTENVEKGLETKLGPKTD